jgi:hypothetical protein
MARPSRNTTENTYFPDIHPVPPGVYLDQHRRCNMSLSHRRFSYTTGLPLLGVVSVLAWSSPAWSWYPTLHDDDTLSSQIAHGGLVLAADSSGTGSRGAGQGPSTGTGPGSGRGTTGGTGKGSPGGTGPGSGMGTTGATEGTGNPGGGANMGGAGSSRGTGGSALGGGTSSGGMGGGSGSSGGSGSGGGGQ